MSDFANELNNKINQIASPENVDFQQKFFKLDTVGDIDDALIPSNDYYNRRLKEEKEILKNMGIDIPNEPQQNISNFNNKPNKIEHLEKSNNKIEYKEEDISIYKEQDIYTENNTSNYNVVEQINNFLIIKSEKEEYCLILNDLILINKISLLETAVVIAIYLNNGYNLRSLEIQNILLKDEILEKYLQEAERFSKVIQSEKLKKDQIRQSLLSEKFTKSMAKLQQIKEEILFEYEKLNDENNR